MPPVLSNRVTSLQAIGFAIAIAMIWVNELLDLPHRLLGAPPIGSRIRIEEAILESGVILLIGVSVVLYDYWTTRHIRDLEAMVVLCAWCRRVRAEDGTWKTTEEYFRDYEIHSTHGMCPTCTAELLNEPANAS